MMQNEEKLPHLWSQARVHLAPSQRLLLFCGALLLFLLLGLTLWVSVRPTSFERSWFSPWLMPGQQELTGWQGSSVLFSWFHGLGIPGWLFWLCAAACLLGWCLLAHALPQWHPLWSVLGSVGVTAQVWLLWLGRPDAQRWLPWVVGAALISAALAGWQSRSDNASASTAQVLWGWIASLVLIAQGLAWMIVAPLSVKTVAALYCVQLSMLLVLTLYAGILCVDLIHGTLSVSRELGRRMQHGVGGKAWMVLCLLALFACGGLWLRNGGVALGAAGLVAVGVFWILWKSGAQPEEQGVLASKVSALVLLLAFLLLSIGELFFGQTGAMDTEKHGLWWWLPCLFAAVWGFWNSALWGTKSAGSWSTRAAPLLTYSAMLVLAWGAALFWYAGQETLFSSFLSGLRRELWLIVALPCLIFWGLWHARRYLASDMQAPDVDGLRVGLCSALADQEKRMSLAERLQAEYQIGADEIHDTIPMEPLVGEEEDPLAQLDQPFAEAVAGTDFLPSMLPTNVEHSKPEVLDALPDPFFKEGAVDTPEAQPDFDLGDDLPKPKNPSFERTSSRMIEMPEEGWASLAPAEVDPQKRMKYDPSLRAHRDHQGEGDERDRTVQYQEREQDFAVKHTPRSTMASSFSERAVARWTWAGSAYRTKRAVLPFVLVGVLLALCLFGVRGLALVDEVQLRRNFGQGQLAWYQGHLEKAQTHFDRAKESRPRWAWPWMMESLIEGRQLALVQSTTASLQAVSHEPQNAHAWRVYGRMLSLQKRHGKAMRAFRRAVALDPTGAYTWRELANGYSLYGLHKEAFAAWWRASKLWPKQALGASWHALHAALLMRAGFFKQAHKAVMAALKISPKDPKAHRIAAFIALSRQRYSVALFHATAAYRAAPTAWDSVQVLIIVRQLLAEREPLSRRRYHRQNRETLLKALHLKSSELRFLRLAIELSRRTDDPQFAAQALALTRNTKSTNSPLFGLLRIQVLIQQKQYRMASVQLKGLKKRFPQAAEAAYWEGRLFQLQGQNEAAESQLSRFLTMKPFDRDGLLALAQVYRKQKRYDKAQAQLQTLFSRDTGGYRAWLERGMLYEAQGAKHKAGRAYRKALDAKQNDKVATRRLAALRYELGEYEEALPLLREVVLDKNNKAPFAPLHLAYSLQQLGLDREALPWFRTFLQRQAQNTFAMEWLARSLHRVGQQEAASRLLAQVLRKQPRLLSAQLLQVRILLARRKTRAAQRKLRRILRRYPRRADVWLLSLEISHRRRKRRRLRKTTSAFLRRFGSDTRALLKLGAFYTRLGKHKKAYRIYVSAAKADKEKQYKALLQVWTTALFRLRKSRLVLRGCRSLLSEAKEPANRALRRALWVCAQAMLRRKPALRQKASTLLQTLWSGSKNKDAAAAVSLARLSQRQKRAQLQWLGAAVKAMPWNVIVRAQYALVLQRWKKKTEAESQAAIVLSKLRTLSEERWRRQRTQVQFWPVPQVARRRLGRMMTRVR